MNVIFWGGLWVIGSIGAIGIKEGIKDGGFKKYWHRGLVSSQDATRLYVLEREIKNLKEDFRNDK